MAGLASGRPFALWLPAHLADSRCQQQPARARKNLAKAVGRHAISDGSAIELMDRNCRKVDALEASEIDHSHAIALGVRRLRVRMDAASGTKAMFHGVLVEGASACSIVGSPQDQIAPGNKPQQ
jgi:hypothetical protein